MIVRGGFVVAARNMGKGAEKGTALLDELEHAGDRDIGQGVKHRMIDRIAGPWVAHRPGRAFLAFFNLHMRVVARGNPPVDGANPLLQQVLQRRKLGFNGFQQAGFGNPGEDAVLVGPRGIAQQVILKTPKLNTGRTKHLTRVDGLAELAIDQELVAVADEVCSAVGIGGIERALFFRRDEAGREIRRVDPRERLPGGEMRLQITDGLQNRGIRAGRGEVERLEQWPQAGFRPLGQGIHFCPIERRIIDGAAGEQIVGQFREACGRQMGIGGVQQGCERGFWWVLRRRKEFEHVAHLGQIFGDRRLDDGRLFLHGGGRFILILLDQVQEAGDDVIVEPQIPPLHKTEQVERANIGIKCLQAGEGIEAHEPGIMRDRGLGNAKHRQHRSGALGQGLQERTTGEFVAHDILGEVLGIMFNRDSGQINPPAHLK